MSQEIYQDIVLDHFRNAHHRETVGEDAPGYITLKNPSCGDIVTLSFDVDPDGGLKVVHNAQGCAASVASTSIMCEKLNGLSVGAAIDLVARFMSALNGEESDSSWDDIELEALCFFKNVPARKLCVSMAWSCAEKALATGNWER